MEPTDGEQACFEAGIKLGSLYHQFAGTPVSPESADSLAGAIEESIENQPFCTDASVAMHTDRIADAVRSGPDGDGGYTELTGQFLDVEVVIEREGTRVRAAMALDDDGYPLMRIESVESVDRD